PIADFLEAGVVAGVAGEEEAFRRAFDGPRGPEPAILIVESTAGRVLRGRADDGEASELRAAPPVELHDVVDPAGAEPLLQSERDEEARMMIAREPPDGSGSRGARRRRASPRMRLTSGYE